jgi:hypothetical protein
MFHIPYVFSAAALALKPTSSDRSARGGLFRRIDGFCKKYNRPHIAAGGNESFSMDTVEACIIDHRGCVYRSCERVERYSCRLNKARPRPF